MPSSHTLRQVAQQPNPSAQRLNAPLPALDENCELGQVHSKSTDSTVSQPEPEAGRLRKVKSAIQTRLPFWGSKEKDKGNPTTQEAQLFQDDASMNYTSDMVDVLDTLGKSPSNDAIPQSNEIRS